MADLPVVCTDTLKEEEALSVKPSEKSDAVSVVEVVNDAMSGNGVAFGPITPDADRESGDFPLDLKSPLLLISSPKAFEYVDPGSPHTPKEGVFDPFAPGPEELAMAPLCKKRLCKPWASLARCIDFSSATESVEDKSFASDADTLSDEETVLESVYGSLLEAIVLNQTEEFFSGVSSPKSDSDGFKTPESVPHLTGVAETCPGAPLKPTMKLRIIDKGLCRKLDFNLLDI